jgi:hypothetical protein
MSTVKTKGSKEVFTTGKVGGTVRAGNDGIGGFLVGAEEVGASVLLLTTVGVFVGTPVVGVVVGVSVGAKLTAVEGSGVTGAGVTKVGVTVIGVSVIGAAVGLGVVARVGHMVGFAVGAKVGQ